MWIKACSVPEKSLERVDRVFWMTCIEDGSLAEKVGLFWTLQADARGSGPAMTGRGSSG